MKNIIQNRIDYNFSNLCKGTLLLPDVSEIKTTYSNHTRWLVIDGTIKKLNRGVDFEYLKWDIEHRGLDISQIYCDFEGKKISYEIKLLREPLKLETDNWQERFTKWDVIINNQNFEYYTGIINRTVLNHMTYSEIGKFRIKIQELTSKYDLQTLLSCSKAIKPKIDDVLYALISDYQCAQDSFNDFCSNLGYDTDSRKALQIYLDCQENGEKLRKTGLNLDKLSEAFQDY